jgi:hypothetical protein
MRRCLGLCAGPAGKQGDWNENSSRTDRHGAGRRCAFHQPGHETDGPAGKLGSVHFKVSCNAVAQREFDLAMAYYHSFAMELVGAPLDRALQADGACGMTYWLRALASLDNPFAWPANISAKTLADGGTLLEHMRRLASVSATTSTRWRASSRTPTS